ncbi:MAG: hypothetical protein EAZ42_01590 [Verrucomicrobia bacterium]|nr:MAG: hypothetical protein EAZ42_01590 [Verrucomicrobiota bacterium]
MKNIETSPFFEALGRILHGPGKTANPAISLLDYNDTITFSALWIQALETGKSTICGREIDLTDAYKQILIIGNHPPDGVFETDVPSLTKINFRDHFTATSWLAAWKVKFPDAKAAIAVIDPQELCPASGTARALQTILGARNVLGQPLVPRAAVLNAPGLEAICKWLSDSKLDKRSMFKDTPHLCGLLKSTIWSELTSNREQHHALSNVLGAFLLPFQAAPGCISEFVNQLNTHFPIAPYLLELATACGVKSNTNRLADDNDANSQWWISEQQQQAFSSIVMIDDMADLWSWFVQFAFGLIREGSSEFITIPSREFPAKMGNLCERLTAVIASEKPLNPSDLTGEPHHADSNFVLLLDLRLELGREFQSQLEDLGRTLLNSTRNLPWVTIEGKQALLAELNAANTDETLLPRLVALIDPTLPIIVFSSTHRSELIAPFRDYGNIITTFRKPILAGLCSSWSEMVGEIRSDFSSAVDHACKIMDTRKALASFRLDRAICENENTGRPKRFIEIYIDESGDPFNQRDPGFSVGGIVVSHENKDAMEAFHRSVNHAPRKWGVSDYGPDQIRPGGENRLNSICYFPKKPVPGSEDEVAGFQLAIDAARGSGSRIAAFSILDPELLRFSRDRVIDSAILFDENALDNIYHTLLRQNLEMLLFEHPWINISVDAVYVHAATRQQKLADFATRSTWHAAYGIEFKERAGNWNYTSLDCDGVHRIVRGILKDRGVLDGRPDVRTARGAVLNDFEDIINNFRRGPQMLQRVRNQLFAPNRVDPKQIHYLADWVARIALYRPNDLPASANEWFSSGYIQVVQEPFNSLFRACAMKDNVEAINHMRGVSLTPVDRLATSYLAERFLRKSASKWDECLTGSEFKRLF